MCYLLNIIWDRCIPPSLHLFILLGRLPGHERVLCSDDNVFSPMRWFVHAILIEQIQQCLNRYFSPSICLTHVIL